MGNRKGVKIDIIYLDGTSGNGKMQVITEDGSEMKVTRQERSVLANYKSSTYEEEICRFFHNPYILGKDFRVVYQGDYVYGNHKLQ